ncbi:hypothetical protein EIN_324570 [Entamoeba invadens IP1]|uniref:Uncharacterized protein n=1 Tax=Entamoeba invadens IP1 TaxID=370355 RepID=L7FQ48_ENTIV|nr:hypothetical protein EIN_324570 [Entamoeba invadens IP1]ELP92509.1 hypothetical protein EIN_324570 [Entamoeba invadens IP1]|eukprot:XP_004259280.1 hypothetical protein EIN_324570 [Entamoeba invadens IP1]
MINLLYVFVLIILALSTCPPNIMEETEYVLTKNDTCQYLESIKFDFAKEKEAKKLKTENDEIKEEVKNLANDKDQLSSEKKRNIADLEQQVQDLEYRPVGTSNIDRTEVIKRDNQIVDLEKAVAVLKEQNTQLDVAKKDMKKQLKTLWRLRIMDHRLRHLKHKRRWLWTTKRRLRRLQRTNLIEEKNMEDQAKALNAQVSSFNVQVSAPASVNG